MSATLATLEELQDEAKTLADRLLETILAGTDGDAETALLLEGLLSPGRILAARIRELTSDAAEVAQAKQGLKSEWKRTGAIVSEKTLKWRALEREIALDNGVFGNAATAYEANKTAGNNLALELDGAKAELLAMVQQMVNQRRGYRPRP